MKILAFQGGLGNQIFCYAFYLYMNEKYPHQHIYGLYNKKKLSEHYGLEINKWFDVQLPPRRWYATILCAACYLWKQIVGKTRLVDTERDYCENEDATAFLAFKYTNQYFPKGEWIRFKIDDEKLSKRNRALLVSIRTTQSVFVHVRRGDFLSPQYKTLFEGTCPIDYYEKSITHIQREVTNPKFFVFSDDMAWVKTHLALPQDAVFVDWNKSTDSPLDMYLMSQCKYAIIANSTFSYWGAFLGEKKHLVFYPERWNNGVATPTIFPIDWIKY